MAGYFTESNYENAVLQLLNEELGYNYIYGPDVERDYHSPLYEDVLLPSLQRINKNLPMDALTEAIYKLKNFETGTLLQKNMVFMDYLQNGVSVKYYDKGEERSTLVYLVDFKNPANNEFTVANQWTFIENSEKRPDVILFVNGLPLVIVELKSPSREETDASAAYRQLRNYSGKTLSLHRTRNWDCEITYWSYLEFCGINTICPSVPRCVITISSRCAFALLRESAFSLVT